MKHIKLFEKFINISSLNESSNAIKLIQQMLANSPTKLQGNVPTKLFQDYHPYDWSFDYRWVSAYGDMFSSVQKFIEGSGFNISDLALLGDSEEAKYALGRNSGLVVRMEIQTSKGSVLYLYLEIETDSATPYRAMLLSDRKMLTQKDEDGAVTVYNSNINGKSPSAVATQIKKLGKSQGFIL